MIALVIAAALAQSYYTPEEASALFAEGNAAATAGDSERATAAWEKLIAHGHRNADVFYNLGTTALQAGDLGHAVLNLERAHRVQRADDIEANLAAARRKQLDQIVGSEGGEPFHLRLASALNMTLVGQFTIGAAWVWLLLVVWYARTAPGRRLWPALAASFVFLLSAVGASLVAIAWSAANEGKDAVVLVPVTQVRKAPEEKAAVSFEVHAGLKVRLVEESGNFVRIRLPNGLEGWTEKGASEPL